MMKKIITVAAAVLAVCSCQKELEKTEQVVSNEDLPKVTAYAPGYKPESKTVIQNETEVWWGPKDSINVFFGVDCNLGKFTSLSNSAQKATVFMGEKAFAMGSIAESSPLKFWSAYPYNASNTCDNTAITLTVPETQTAVAGSFDPKAFPSIARSNDMTFAFYNVCGGVRISVSKAGISKVVFKGNNGEFIAGKVKVSMGSDGKPVHEVVEGKTEVTLNCKDGLTVGTWYYISLLPVSLTSGYTMYFETDYEWAEKITSSGISVGRSVFGSLTNPEEGLAFKQITPELVDLGLSIKWASFNLGTKVPEGCGRYYQWADTQGYGSDTSDGKRFSWDSYKWCKGAENTVTKYCLDSQWGTVDNKSTLEMKDDAARAALGRNWRIPTVDEWIELRENCTWSETTLNGVKGFKVQSDMPGYTDRWIFLPLAGSRSYSKHDHVGYRGCYWSSSLFQNSNGAWMVIYPYPEQDVINNAPRYCGYSIRPVSDGSTDYDLSEDGTANCYIVTGAGKYRFNASMKGGSSESVGEIASAEVLWESYGTSTAPQAGALVNSVSYTNNFIHFIATSAKGNAVIAAKDASGNILWSWHIWLTDQPENQVYNHSAGTMMDRNLGATSATKGDVQALGLHYQWGRKDPFTSAASTISWPSVVNSNATTGTISYAVAHPTTFICGNDKNLDWQYTGDDTNDNTRWRSLNQEKGLYDPCPVGYRVPDGGSDGIWSNAFWEDDEWTTPSNWDSINKGMDFAKTDIKLSDSASSVWYPAAGSFTHYSGEHFNVGDIGNYWSCTPSRNNRVYIMQFFGDGEIDPCEDWEGLRSEGESVRCVRK